MATIGSLTVKLGLVTVQWDQATKKAKQDAKDLQKSFNDLGVNLKGLQNTFKAVGGSLGLSLVGITAMTKATMDFAGQVDDLSKSFDVSIAKVLQFQQAIVLSGGKAEDAGKIMATMFGKISEAQAGNDKMIATFEKLGISFDELRRTSPDEMIGKVYRGLANIGNTYERIKLTKEILGKGGLGKSVEEIAEALGKSDAAFRKQEEAMKRLAALGDTIDNTYMNLKLAFAEMLSPFVGGASGQAVASINEIKAAFVAVTAVATVAGLAKIVALTTQLVKVLKDGASVAAGLQALQGAKGVAMLGAGALAYFGAKKFFDNQDENAPPSSTPESVPSDMPAGSGGVSNEVKALRAKIELQRESLKIDKARGEYKLWELDNMKFEAQLGEVELARQEEIAKAKSERAAAVSKEGQSAAMIAAINEEYQLKIDAAEQKARQSTKYINEQRNIGIRLLEEQVKLEAQTIVIEEARARLDGEKRNMSTFEFQMAEMEIAHQQRLLQLEQQRADLKNQYAQGSPEMAAASEKINQQIQAENRLHEIRVTNAQNEKELSKSWLAGWQEAFEQYKESAENSAKTGAEVFNSVVQSMDNAIDEFVQTGKLNFKEFARSAIQSLIAIQMKAQAMKLLSMAFGSFGIKLPGAADGGFINSPTIVGENGPEVFIPNRQGGTIVPTQQAAGMSNQQPAVVYNGPYIANMQAIDTQSATQFLARNKSAVYAANVSAQRSIPTSR